MLPTNNWFHKQTAPRILCHKETFPAAGQYRCPDFLIARGKRFSSNDPCLIRWIYRPRGIKKRRYRLAGGELSTAFINEDADLG
jgi:hypothetical protein